MKGIGCFESAAHADTAPKLGTEIGWTCLSADSMELLEEIEFYQAGIAKFQVAKEASELRKEELEALLEETKVPQRRGSRLVCTPEQVQLKRELQASLHTVQPAGQATWSADQCSDGSCGSDVGCNSI